MSLKSIELQVALPRSQNAGKIQEQISKEGQRFQDSLAQTQIEQDIKKRKTVNEFDKLKQTKNEDEESKYKSTSSLKGEEDLESKSEETIEHPFLGSKIDFSG